MRLTGLEDFNTEINTSTVLISWGCETLFAERRDAHAGSEKKRKKRTKLVDGIGWEGRRAEGVGGGRVGGGGVWDSQLIMNLASPHGGYRSSSGIACVLRTVTVLTRTKQLGKGF